MARDSSNANVSAPGGSAVQSAHPSLVPLGHVAGKPPIPLHRPVMLIGSRSNAHIHLLSSHVSKAHALLVISEGNVYVRDLASRERVYVNGQELHDGLLKDGDLIKIGSFTFKLQLPRRSVSRLTSAPGGALRIEAEDKTIGVDHRVLLIGRRPGSDITLVENSVSTSHAVIVEMNGKRYARDLGSRTGTFINGKQIHQEEIRFGDVLRVGDTEMRYVAAVAKAELDEMEDLIGTAPLVDQDEKPAIEESFDAATIAAIAASVERPETSAAEPESEQQIEPKIEPAAEKTHAQPEHEDPMEIVVPLAVEPIAEATEQPAPEMAEEPPAAPETSDADVLELDPLPLAGEAPAPEPVAEPVVEPAVETVTETAAEPEPEPVLGEALVVETQATHTVESLEIAPALDLTVEAPVEPAPEVPAETPSEPAAESAEPAEAATEAPALTGRKQRAAAKREPKPKKVRKPRRQKLQEEPSDQVIEPAAPEAPAAPIAPAVTGAVIAAEIADASQVSAEPLAEPVAEPVSAPAPIDLTATLDTPLLPADESTQPPALPADEPEAVLDLSAEPVAPAAEVSTDEPAGPPPLPSDEEWDRLVADAAVPTGATVPALDVREDLEQQAAAAEVEAKEALDIEPDEPPQIEPPVVVHGELVPEPVLDLQADTDETSGPASLSDTQFAKEVEQFAAGGEPVMEEVFDGEVVEKTIETSQVQVQPTAPVESLLLDPEMDLAAAEIETPPLETMSGLVSSGLTVTGTPPIRDDQWSATIAVPLEDEGGPGGSRGVVVSAATPAPNTARAPTDHVYQMPTIEAVLPSLQTAPVQEPVAEPVAEHPVPEPEQALTPDTAPDAALDTTPDVWSGDPSAAELPHELPPLSEADEPPLVLPELPPETSAQATSPDVADLSLDLSSEAEPPVVLDFGSVDAAAEMSAETPVEAPAVADVADESPDPAPAAPAEATPVAGPASVAPAADDFFGISGQDFSFLGGIPLSLDEVQQPRNFGRVQVTFGDKQLRGSALGAEELPGSRQVLEQESQLQPPAPELVAEASSLEPALPASPSASSPDPITPAAEESADISAGEVVTNLEAPPAADLGVLATESEFAIEAPSAEPPDTGLTDAPADAADETDDAPPARPAVIAGARINIPHPTTLSGRAPVLPRLATFDRDPFESPAPEDLDDEIFEEQEGPESGEGEIPHPTGVFDGLALSMGAGTDAFSQTAAPQHDPFLGGSADAIPAEEIVIPPMEHPAKPAKPAKADAHAGESDEEQAVREATEAQLPDEFPSERGLPDGFWGDDSASRHGGVAEQAAGHDQGAPAAVRPAPGDEVRRPMIPPTIQPKAQPPLAKVATPPAASPRRPAAAPHPRHRTLAKFQMLGVLMVLCMLGAWGAIMMWVPVSGTVTASMRFANAEKNPGAWTALDFDQRAILKNADVRQRARAMSEIALASTESGFLDPASDSFAKMVEAARWDVADGNRVLTLSVPSKNPKADSDRMFALLKAVYNADANRARRSEYDRLREDMQFRKQRIDFLQDQITKKKDEVGRLRTAAAARPSDQLIAELDKAATEAAAAWSEARAAAAQLQKQIEQIEASSPTTNPNDPGATIDIAADTDLKTMSQRLDDLNRQLEDARQRKGVQADGARQSLENLTKQFQEKMQELQGAINASPQVRQYVSAAQELLAKTQQITEELIQAQRNQHEKIFEMKRRLDNKMAERKAELLARDEQLVTMKKDREMYKHQINAGEGSGNKDPLIEAAVREAKVKLATLETQIRDREDKIGQDQLYTETIKQLDEYIRQDADQLEKHRKMKTELLDTIQTVFDRSRPEVEKLPDDQKKLAGDVTKLMAKMDEQRTAITLKLDNETKSIEDAQKRLEEQATKLTTKIETRRADLLALRRQNLDDQQKTQIVQKRQELAALRQKETEAQTQWITRSDRLKAQQQIVVEANYASKELTEKVKSLQQDEQEVADKLREQPAKEAAMQNAVYPIEPLPGHVHQTIDKDQRMIYLLGAVALIAVTFIAGLFITARTGGGAPGQQPDEPKVATEQPTQQPQQPATL